MSSDPNDWKQWWEWIRPALHIVVIWVMAPVALWAIRRLLRILNTQVAARTDGVVDARRIETLMNVFRYTANIVIVGIAILLTLGTIGISVTPILATAGVAGIAIGFGAQSLVKDFFTGLFLLIENQISEGDVIEAAGKSGHVERMTLRHTRIRDYDGSVHFIPNSMITTVTNRSRDYAYAIIDMNVKRHEDLDQVFAQMREIVAGMRADATFASAILADIDIAGVEKVEDATVGVRCRLKVQPSRQWRIRREFLRRMKIAMDDSDDIKSAA